MTTTSSKASVNIYRPMPMVIEEIIDETIDTKTLRLSFRDKEDEERFDFKAGQFGEYSVFGEGECIEGTVSYSYSSIHFSFSR